MNDKYTVDDIETMADAAVYASRQWLLSRNRNVLGSFACSDIEYLILRQAYMSASHRYYYDTNWIEKLALPIMQVLDERQRQYQIDHYSSRDLPKAVNEILFWWGISDDALLVKYSHKGAPDMIMLQTMHDIYDYPARLPYFEAGVTDVDIIDRCIAEDIDASIAVELQGNVLT